MNKPRNNMATTHPRLLKWFASKNPWFVFLKIIPLLIAFVWMIYNTEASKTHGLLFLLFGLVTWSFFEYATHRWIYHTVFKRKNLSWFLDAFHLHHHHNLTDYRVLNAGLFLIYPLAAFFWLLIFLLTKNIALASWFGLGTLLYYFFYENVHFFIHYKIHDKGYMKFIQKYHLHHHYKRWNKNFGNTTTFWDKLFRTYDPEYKQFEVNGVVEHELIKH
jgi:4-hydroxysphinganine ceramide fatty acyl 2-hydroxylase